MTQDKIIKYLERSPREIDCLFYQNYLLPFIEYTFHQYLIAHVCAYTFLRSPDYSSLYYF